MNSPRVIYAVQSFVDGAWHMVYVSTSRIDADNSYRLISFIAPVIRLVSFSVDGLGFIATHCRDFAVLDRRA